VECAAAAIAGLEGLDGPWLLCIDAADGELELDLLARLYIPATLAARELFHQISLVSPLFLLAYSGRSRCRPWGASLRSAIVPSGCGIPKR
jgi:hypothetical protein